MSDPGEKRGHHADDGHVSEDFRYSHVYGIDIQLLPGQAESECHQVNALTWFL